MADTLARLTSALADRYRIGRELGHGGMATVYLAEDLKHHRQVAIKVLKPELAAVLGPERFLREIHIAAQLNHPHILPLFDSGETAGQLWYVMPLVEGESLRERLNRERQLPLEEALAVTREVADALGFAHSRGIVHRDIKPENILLSGGHALVADLGIARALEPEVGTLTETGMVVGTPGYMSPEQASGEGAVDARSDLYALGCVLYEMLAGEPPYTGPTTQAILAKQVADPVPSVLRLRDTVPAALDEALRRALAKAPADRFATATQFAKALRESGAEVGRSLMTRPWRMRAVWVTTSVLLMAAGWWVLSVRAVGRSRIQSVAVLPLVDLSGGPEEAYFADGMTEALITELSKIAALKVISRTTAMRYRGTDKPLPKIARELKVDAVVEGSVVRAGARVRITAQLIEASTDRHLWAESYERDLPDVLKLQGEVARAISREIRVKLTPQEEVGLARRREVAPAAYEAYLKGRYFWNKRTEDGLKKAIEHFREAIEADPNYAPAHAGLADSYLMLNVWGYLRHRDAIPVAKAAASRALQLDENLAEAHASLGLLKIWGEWDWTGAESEFKRAIGLNPGYATAYHWYSLYLTAVGRTEEGIAAIRRAQELDPLSLIISTIVGTRLYFARRYQEAIGQYRTALELDANYEQARLWLGIVYSSAGRFDLAIAELENALKLSGGSAIMRAAMTYAYAVSGQRAKALNTLQRVRRQSSRGYVSPYWMAVAYTGLGERDQAFGWLEQAYEEPDGWLLNLKIDPAFDPLRSDPRFTRLLTKLGL